MKKEKILIVDDTPENIHILMETLKHNYAIIAAKNGEKAVQMANTEPLPDLILLDIMMPKMDGYAVCQELKANELTKNIPIIFVTALADNTNEEKGLKLGAMDYISKPFSPAIVQRRVKNLLTLMRTQRMLEKQNDKLVEAARLKEDVERITRHDLKAPLSAIIGLPDLMLLDDNITDKQRQFLKLVWASGYRMLNMINNSLDLYKMEVGSYQLHPKTVNLIPILSKTITEFSCNTTPKKITVQIMHDNKPSDLDEFLIVGEELLCYSLFANLLKNAIEASPENQLITVSLANADTNAIIAIHNHGTVPEDIRPRFFEKYTTSKQSGTGLGTYSAWLTTKSQGGKIDFISSVDAGTTITVQLPKPAEHKLSH